MRRHDIQFADSLEGALKQYHNTIRPLPGITQQSCIQSLIEQVIDSRRRIEFVNKILSLTHSPNRADPLSDLFDPLRESLHK